MYDIIGDIHGHADALETLLTELGYEKRANTYKHPERKVLFVGDYIDRGPKIRETLQIVRSMVEAGHAIALMGNHEYNAICFHYPESEGGHLRPHLIKNIIQHFQTLAQFQNRQEEFESYLEWFTTLPLFFENEDFRAVHVCWDDHHMEFLRSKLINNRLTDDLIYESARQETHLRYVLEDVLKGKELKLPEGIPFTDKDKNVRHETRVRWWEDPANKTLRDISITPLEELPKLPLGENVTHLNLGYAKTNKPIFFGHYWLRGKPDLFTCNVCCLDYSIAKGGNLVAYRMDEEDVLDASKLVYV